MDRQTDRWTGRKTDRFSLALGRSSTQTRPWLCHSLIVFAGVGQTSSFRAPPDLTPNWVLPPLSTQHTRRIKHRRHTCTHPNPLPTGEALPAEPGDSSRDRTGGSSRVSTSTPAYCQGFRASWHTVNRRLPQCRAQCTHEDNRPADAPVLCSWEDLPLQRSQPWSRHQYLHPNHSSRQVTWFWVKAHQSESLMHVSGKKKI